MKINLSNIPQAVVPRATVAAVPISVNLNGIRPVLGPIQPPMATGSLMQATDYQKLPIEQQIILRPSMYIGSVSKTYREEQSTLMDAVGNEIQMRKINLDYPYGCERLFFEILYNASDNVFNSRDKNHNIGEITITMDKEYVSIRNGGLPISIDQHPDDGQWTPFRIFNDLLVSSSYNKKRRTGIGQNGFGAKLTRLFSTYFSCDVGNPYNRKRYQQEWSIEECNNYDEWVLLNKGKKQYTDPIITDYTGEPYVEIKFRMNFKYFGYISYPDDIVSLYRTYAAEVSANCRVPITFNGYRFNFSSFAQFSLMMTAKNTDNYIVHYEYPSDTKLKPSKQLNGTITMVAEDPNITPIMEIVLIDSVHDPSIFSYCNSANTRVGGIHVEAVYDSLNSIVESINNQGMGTESKKDRKGLSRKFLLNKSDLKRHMSVVVSCWVENPDCGAQEKVKFAAYGPDNDRKKSFKVQFNEKATKSIMNWDIIGQLLIDLEAKTGKLAERSTKRTKRLVTDTIQDAYYAGGKQGHLCTLYRTEGKSAMSYAHNMRSEMTEEKMQYVGISCESGKPMNLTNKSLFRILQSKKYQELVEHLGLTEQMDYTIEENYKTLRYGFFGIMADSDVDGKHIISLLLNIFYCRHRSLLKIAFAFTVRTPIIRVEKGKQIIKFYNLYSYSKWVKDTPDFAKWKHNYYKGLASSTNEEVADDTKNPKVAWFIYDDSTPDAMSLAFSKDADRRKEWIREHQSISGIEDIEQLPISTFIKSEAVEYAVTNLGRSIPRFDGLKESQRKIVFGSKKKWGSSVGSSNVKPLKVDQLANHSAEVSLYKYGAPSLIGAINRMAADWPGTNNLEYFYRKGQFGTRNDDGKDVGQPRYISTWPNWWWPLVFRSEDESILVLVVDQDDIIEPVVYLATVPLFMINGCLGIGSGNSTFIPQFNPIDIIMFIVAYLKDLPRVTLIPWFRGFTGTVELKATKKSLSDPGVQLKILPKEGDIIMLPGDPLVQNEAQNEDEEEEKLNTEISLNMLQVEPEETVEPGEATSEFLKVVTTGVFNIVDSKKLIVTEIPIGMSIKQYEKFLSKKQEEKMIKDFKNLSKHSRPKFEIMGYGELKTKESLCLARSFSMTNMVLLTENNTPIKFKDQYDCMNQWIEWRLPFYAKRKENRLSEINAELTKLGYKLKLAIAIVEGSKRGYIPGETILVMDQELNNVHSQMDGLNIPREYIKDIKVTNLLKDKDIGIGKLRDRILKVQNEYKELEALSSKDIWLNDLREFRDAYLKQYPEERSRVVYNF